MRKYSLALFVALIASFAFASTASAAPFVFTSAPGAISVPDNATLTPASAIEVTTPGLITRVEVRLKNVSHTRPADLDVIVETPSGQFIYLMSDQCGVDDVANYEWSFADDFTHLMGVTNSSCGFSNYHPSDNAADTDGWTTAPGAAPVTTFAGLTGTNQTGEWRLHVDDDTAGETGSINSGWEIRIDTTTPDATRIGPPPYESGTVGPIKKVVSGLPRAITDVDVQLNGLTHTYPDDLDFALVSPAGTKVLFASDGCGGDDRLNVNWVFDDEATTPFPEFSEGTCGSSTQRFAPFNNPTIETAFGTAFSGGPFGSSLSAFDGQVANGEWKLYIDDDTTGDYGYLAGYDLAITTRGAKVLSPSDPTLKYKKSGKSIRATGRVALTGEALTPGECGGSVKSSFQSKVVRKKGKKKITSYKQVVSVNSALNETLGSCGFDISAKLAKKYSGKKLRLVTSYLGGDYIAPFTRTTSEKIKKIKF